MFRLFLFPFEGLGITITHFGHTILSLLADYEYDETKNKFCRISKTSDLLNLRDLFLFRYLCSATETLCDT